MWASKPIHASCLRLGHLTRMRQFRFCSGEVQFVNWRGKRSEAMCVATQRDELEATIAKEKAMPLVDIQLIEGAFDKAQKQEMIRTVTDAMVAIEGEAMRGVTWVRVHEVASGEWGIGGKGLTAADVKAMSGR